MYIVVCYSIKQPRPQAVFFPIIPVTFNNWKKRPWDEAKCTDINNHSLCRLEDEDGWDEGKLIEPAVVC